ncbi:MAG TPA: ABC transporter ATP-binding protein [Candidatus Margulisiibacteriota bacterium]|nr:ABC transporter ATP-binding protein [Candidatus Margulisiibacteriota bacterium]
MSMETAAVVLDQVSKRYGNGSHGVPALSAVTLRVWPAEFVAIMGPSGCGKSTLLNLIAGIDTPSSGRVSVAGHELSALSDDARSDLRLRAVGFVFQSFNLLPTFTAEENVALPLEFMGLRRRETRTRTADALARVGIPTQAQRRRPAELSGGEQQRVAIARALVAQPRLLLADEPTGNLDSHAGEGVLNLLQTLNAAEGLTVVLVTHSLTAAAYAQRIVQMRDGRIEEERRQQHDAAREPAPPDCPVADGCDPVTRTAMQSALVPSGNGQMRHHEP